MAYIDKAKIEEILSKVDIVDVISSYLPLTKVGKNYKCVCPFHDDHSPSMSISQTKQMFKCFVCGEGGNALKFVQQYENISFQKAVQKVAELAGVKIDININDKAAIYSESDYRKFQIINDVKEFAFNNLFSEQGKNALNYLVETRRLNLETIKDYEIGYIHSTEQLMNFLTVKGYSLDEITESSIMTREGRTFLYNRVSFPVHNPEGKCVGFSSRLLSGEGPKYINSTESVVFQKNKILFNYHIARKEVYQKKELILVEGQLNVLSLKQNGIKNVVAQMGTALTQEHISLLKNMKVPIKIMYDADNAGIQAAKKTYSILKENKIQCYMVMLNEGMDPDDMLKNDKEKLLELVETKEGILDYLLYENIDTNNFETFDRFIVQYLNVLKSENNVLADEFYLSKLAKKINIDVNVLKNKYQSLNGDIKITTKVKQESKRVAAKISDRKVMIHLKVKNKLDYKNEVTVNYDRLSESEKVIVFNKNNFDMSRADMLKNYISQKGVVLETIMTLVNYENVDLHVQRAANEVCASCADSLDIDPTNMEYIAFLHKDTKHPHVHLQMYQRETYLDNYKLSSKLVEDLTKKVTENMESSIFEFAQKISI